MKKKIVFSLLASASILFATAGAEQAEASTQTPVSQQNVVVYQSSNTISNYYQYLQKYFQNCQIKWNNANNWTAGQTPQQKSTEAPVQQTPVEKPTPTPVQQPEPKPAEPPKTEVPANAEMSAFEQQVIDLTNQERAKYGLPALKVDANLSKAAKAKSLDMQQNRYFSHTSPTYGSPFDMMKKFGVTFRGAGENIAMGQRSPQEVVNSWMNSTGHRANILNQSFTHIGVGHAENGNYWTQMFITK